jgi:F-type H+-transporting ATPase subunit alpha
VLAFEKGLHAFFHQNNAELMKKIDETGDWDKDIEATFKAGTDEFKKTGSW